MRPDEGYHQEEGISTIPAAEEVHCPIRDPAGGVCFLRIGPGTRYGSIAIDTGIRHIYMPAALHIVKIIIYSQLCFAGWGGRLAVIMQKAVVQFHILKAHPCPGWMDMHFSDAFCLIASLGETGGQSMFIMPWNSILIAKPPVMAWLHAGQQTGPGGHAGWRGGISTGKSCAVLRQRIQERSFYVRMAVDPEAVTPELIRHKNQHVRSAH